MPHRGGCRAELLAGEVSGETLGIECAHSIVDRWLVGQVDATGDHLPSLAVGRETQRRSNVRLHAAPPFGYPFRVGRRRHHANQPHVIVGDPLPLRLRWSNASGDGR
jgi:hypothetical protein